jgi:hypothetical protein
MRPLEMMALAFCSMRENICTNHWHCMASRKLRAGYAGTCSQVSAIWSSSALRLGSVSPAARSLANSTCRLAQIMTASQTRIMASRKGFLSHMSRELVVSRAARLLLASFCMSTRPRFRIFS